MNVIIDRFEGDVAIVELPDTSTVPMPKKLIPSGAKEGDTLNILIDKERTKKRHENIAKLMDDLFTD